jgi:hypothetical protein
MAWSQGPAAPVERFGFEIRAAWRREDPEVKADAIAFWNRLGILPTGVAPEARAEELIAAAYKDGSMVAVATATLQRVEPLRARFAIVRGATDPEYRRSHAQLALAVPSRETLAEWALAHPEEQLAGAAVAVKAEEWGDFAKLPVWPESELALAGYNADGSQLRLRWFDHFAFGEGPTLETLLPPAPGDYSGIEFREAWRRDDPRIEADAIAFWTRLSILPEGVSPEARARDIVLAAYHEGRIVGLVTATLERLEPLRARLAMIRGAVDPEFRRRRVGLMMMFMIRPTIESWSREHPHERVAGIGAILQASELNERARRPYSPFTRYMLAGFTREGDQLRICWFEDFRLD